MSATEAPEHPVLIVDDEADSREALALVLKSEGYQVAMAADGWEALGYLHQRPPPCVILLDLQTAGMEGGEFLRRQQAEERLARIPVVVISGGLIRGTMAPLRGAVAFFAKPIRIEALLGEIEQWCRPARAEGNSREWGAPASGAGS